MSQSNENESALQKALRGGWTLADISARLDIKVKRHPQFPNLVLFVYDQIDSPKIDPIVTSSRGHVLDESANWRHVCRPFDRFLNWGEALGLVEVPDLSKSVAYKKEDGSLLNLWFYGGSWRFSTKGSADAGGSVGDSEESFSELAWRVWNALGYRLPEDESKTYIFELCTSQNRVVCRQAVERIVLIGVRDNLTGADYNIRDYAHQGWELCGSYDLSSLEDLKKTFMDLSPLEFEGYVVAQHLGGRILRSKVKHPGYLALAHLKEGRSRKNFLDLIRNGEGEEYLLAFPEDAPMFGEVREKYEALVSLLENAWAAHSGIEDQKSFALSIKEVPCNGVLFQKRRFGTSIRASLAAMNLDGLMKAVGLKD